MNKSDALRLGIEVLQIFATDETPEGWQAIDAIGIFRKALEQPEPVEPPSNKYNNKRIAWELERTAMGDGYYGNALYVAMDMAQTTQTDREMLHRYLHGSNLTTDHVKLQDLAMRIYTAPPKREWVGLTDEERTEAANNAGFGHINIALEIEAKLKEKNHD